MTESPENSFYDKKNQKRNTKLGIIFGTLGLIGGFTGACLGIYFGLQETNFLTDNFVPAITFDKNNIGPIFAIFGFTCAFFATLAGLFSAK